MRPFLVHAALVRVDRVGERVERLGVAGVPLHRDLDLAVVALRVDVDDLADGVLALREVLHEVDQAPVGLEDVLVRRVLALVDQLDLHALVEERELAQALGEDLAPELQRLDEDLGVGARRMLVPVFVVALPFVSLPWPCRARRTAST